jgi:hypothetical protein
MQATTVPRSPQRKWGPIIALARDIVNEYDISVTLRQLHYRLVSSGIGYRNTDSDYTYLSKRTAKERRAGTFPDLIDNTSEIHEPLTFTGDVEARDWLKKRYRRNRTEYQDVAVYISAEKNTMVALMESWFYDLGIPILALGGNASQSYVDEIKEHVLCQDRPAVLLYGGDLDSNGEDLARDFIRRSDCWKKVVRVALTIEQVDKHGLTKNPGKPKTQGIEQFVAKYGWNFQVELEALDPAELRRLYQQALEPYWSDTAYQQSLKQERADKAKL